MVASTRALSKVHPDWIHLFPNEFKEAERILQGLDSHIPVTEQVFRVFESAPSDVKVVIVGQDPYPTPADATGLAFSVDRSTNLPKSLLNIFKELDSDLGIKRTSGDLTDWQQQGVFLINRVLTTAPNSSMAHRGIGWEDFTEKVISYLASQGAVALLMGASAQEMSKYFTKKVIVAHPSPLSAYRGFFGSKPFSAINKLLKKPINW